MAQSVDFSRLTQRQCADMHGVDVRTIRRWDEDGHPRNEDGTYDAPKSIAWGKQRDDLDLNAERARLAKAQADKTEMELAVRGGELLERGRVVRDVGAMLSAFRSRVIAIPDAVGQLFDPNTARTVIAEVRRKLHEALAELSEYRPDVSVGSGATGCSAAVSDAESVVGRGTPTQ